MGASVDRVADVDGAAQTVGAGGVFDDVHASQQRVTGVVGARHAVGAERAVWLIAAAVERVAAVGGAVESVVADECLASRTSSLDVAELVSVTQVTVPAQVVVGGMDAPDRGQAAVDRTWVSIVTVRWR
jgi:hypothetical protein